MMPLNHTKNARGFLLLNTIIFGAIATIMITALIGWFTTTVKASRTVVDREQAFQIAEAGIDYYRWHLAHNPTDFQDGNGIGGVTATTTQGPYIHPYFDKDNNRIGQFTITITPPVTGSTKVGILSEGSVDDNPNADRKIFVQLTIPSLAKFAVVANDAMRFGAGTEIYGPVLSNNGIRFDGIAHNIISSARAFYQDPDHTGGPEFGVHTHVNEPPLTGTDDTYRFLESPSSTLSARTDVFQAGRQFPVPATDFAGITADLAQMKADAQASGVYIASSTGSGYDIVLRTDNSFDLYRITAIATASGCVSTLSWSIAAEQFVRNYAIPANGLVFVEDNVWVRGQINGSHITIAAGSFPDIVANRKNITVNTNVRYTNYDGSDTIALIAQNDINVGFYSDNDLRIDGALIAQNGRVGRPYFGTTCTMANRTRNSLTLFGMIGSYGRYGFAYTDGTGYTTRTISYDANLIYTPPPSFPLTGESYNIISWQEVK